jgi:hypothetical protein
VTLAQTQTTRTYTYKLTWNPDLPSSLAPGNITVWAIGVDAQGDAVLGSAAGQIVAIVP